jgi:hypothetical protein
MILKIIFSIFLGLAAASASKADDFSYFGYVSQSMVQGKGVNIGGSKDGKWSFDKREITVFGDYSAKSIQTDFRFAVGTTDEPGLEEEQLHVKYALADKQWRVNDAIVGGRLGRVPHTLGFYNNTRNAPQTGQFIYLPEGIYREQFKWLAMSGDGGQMYVNRGFSNGLSLEVTGTWTKAQLMANREVVSGHFNNPKVGTFDADKSEVRGLSIDGRYQNTVFYYNWINLYFWLKPDFPYSMAIPEGRADTNVHVMGAKQFIGDFEVGAEFLQVKMKDKVWQAVRSATHHLGDPTGWVLSGTWHTNSKLDLSAYHSQYYTAINDKTGVAQSAAATAGGSPMPAEWFYVKANSVAGKYKIDDSWTIRAQYTQGKGIEPFLRSLNPGSNKSWSYSAIQAIYAF